MDEIDTPADLRGDAEILEQAAGILRRYGRQAFAGTLREEAKDLIERSRHPSRQHLRGGTGYTPTSAPEGTESESYRERHGDEPREDPELITAEDVASARHCEIRIDGLPGQLPAGTYAMAFSSMEYPAGASRPVLRFRYAGELNDDATVKQHPAPAAEQAEAEGWLLPPAELPAVYRTKDGRIITDAMIEGWAAEAEAGYDPEKIRERLGGVQILQGAAYKSAQRLSRDLEARDASSPPQPPQQVPDLYQVSTVETINVTRLARVIAELIRKGGLLSPEMIGMKLDPGQGPTREQVERWLRS